MCIRDRRKRCDRTQLLWRRTGAGCAAAATPRAPHDLYTKLPTPQFALTGAAAAYAPIRTHRRSCRHVSSSLPIDSRSSCTYSRQRPSGLDAWQRVWIVVRSVVISFLLGSLTDEPVFAPCVEQGSSRPRESGQQARAQRRGGGGPGVAGCGVGQARGGGGGRLGRRCGSAKPEAEEVGGPRVGQAVRTFLPRMMPPSPSSSPIGSVPSSSPGCSISALACAPQRTTRQALASRARTRRTRLASARRTRSRVVGPTMQPRHAGGGRPAVLTTWLHCWMADCTVGWRTGGRVG
eukprot:2573278-Prymnesium_polylepis.2